MIMKRLRGAWACSLAAPLSLGFTFLAASSALFAQPPSIAESFNPSGVLVGQTSTLTFTINNPSGAPISGVAFSDTFPANLFVQNPNGLTGACGSGTVVAVGGGNSVSLTGGTIAAGGSCTFSLAVLVLHQTSSTAFMSVNTTGNVSASSGTGNAATAALTASPGTFATAKGFSPNSITQGSNSTLIFTVTSAQPNPAFAAQAGDIVFSDPLPAGVVVATPPGVDTGTCLAANPGMVVMATAGSSTIELGSTLNEGGANIGGVSLNAAGTPGDTCSFSVNVTGTTPGTKNNSIMPAIGGTDTLFSNDGVPGTATLTVTAAAMPAVITKAFNPTTVSIGQNSALTFTITNPGLNPLTGVGFTDTFPANLFVQNPNGLTGSCGGGTITASPGTGTVSLSGATLAAGASCSFVVSVTPLVGTPTGHIYTNTTGNVTSNEAGAGNTATAQLTATALSAQFVIGDTDATVGATVTFWGAQWAKDNVLSGGPAPDAFKGFTNTVPASCGGNWISPPGNSSQPPDTVPLFMAVIASSTVTKSGPTIAGDIPRIVIVRTNPGYGPSPGKTGTGTVVAVVCP